MRTRMTVAETISAVDEQGARRLARELVEDDGQLQPDQHEEQRVQQEDDDLPDGVALDARLRGRELGRVGAHVDADSDCRKHRRRA